MLQCCEKSQVHIIPRYVYGLGIRIFLPLTFLQNILNDQRIVFCGKYSILNHKRQKILINITFTNFKKHMVRLNKKCL